MPGILKVAIRAARGLPVMDRRSELTDAFVEVRFAGDFRKTNVCHRSLNPVWSHGEFSFNMVDDQQLHDELLVLRVMDHDTYSAHDAIGRVDIDCGVLLHENKRSHPVVSGWFPIFDTMRGLRGELDVTVSVELIPSVTSDLQGVAFFAACCVPSGYRLVSVFGLVDELVVHEDPEFQFLDKLRTSRTSNEVRVRVFSRLSALVKRKISVKSADLGANAVLGYHQAFDIEGDTGVVVRGYGTAVYMLEASRSLEHSYSANLNTFATSAAATGTLVMPATAPPPPIILPATPESPGNPSDDYIAKLGISMLEYPFFTLTSFECSAGAGSPPIVSSLGGVVCARSVKLLDRIEDPDKPLMRDNWWLELRNEVRSHMESLGCTCVIGYTETTSIYEDLIVLSAFGTAALLDSAFIPSSVSKFAAATASSISSMSTEAAQLDLPESGNLSVSPRSPLRALGAQGSFSPTTNPFQFGFSGSGGSAGKSGFSSSQPKCGLLHLPYNETSLPFATDMPVCPACRAAKVHEVLLCSTEPPPTGDAKFLARPAVLHATVLQKKRRGHGEAQAIELSACLPFIEHELHTKILYKLQLLGMNSVFGLKIDITVTQHAVIGVASGTAFHLQLLPSPLLVNLPNKVDLDDVSLNETRSAIEAARRELSNLKLSLDGSLGELDVDVDSGGDTLGLIDQDHLPNAELGLDGKQVQTFSPKPLEDHVVRQMVSSLSSCVNRPLVTVSPVANPIGEGLVFRHMIVQMSMLDGYDGWSGGEVSKSVDNTLQRLHYKARKCHEQAHVVNIRPQLSTCEDDCAILCVTADVCEPVAGGPGGHDRHDEMIFNLFSRSPVQISSMCSLPEYTVDHYLGYINGFFIRETSDLKGTFGSTQCFISCCLNEVIAILKARVYNTGGNALLSFQMIHLVVFDNPNKNQAQALLNICGDVAKLTPKYISSA